MSNSKLKTASELALEYWNKPPIERVNTTLQNYVYDYMVSKLLEKDVIIADLNKKVIDQGQRNNDLLEQLRDFKYFKQKHFLELKLSDNPILQSNVYKHRNTDHGDIFNSFELFDLNIDNKEENETND